MMGLKITRLKWIRYIWFGFLIYLIIGGALGIAAEAFGFVDGFCNDNLAIKDTVYEACKPCGLYGSVFGVIEVGNCSNKFVSVSLKSLISIPRAFLACIAILIFPVVELLSATSDILPYLALVPFLFLMGIKTARHNFYEKKNVGRGVNRILLIAIMGLALYIAMRF